MDSDRRLQAGRDLDGEVLTDGKPCLWEPFEPCGSCGLRNRSGCNDQADCSLTDTPMNVARITKDVWHDETFQVSGVLPSGLSGIFKPFN